MKYGVVESSVVYELVKKVNAMLEIPGWELAGPLVTHGEGSSFTYSQPMVYKEIMSMFDYVIIEGKHTEDLRMKVQHMIDNNWQLYGNPVIAISYNRESVYAQAMMKHKS